MWDGVWKWAVENYIFHVFAMTALLFIIFNSRPCRQMLRRIKRIGSVELHADSDISPDTPCPYIKSRDVAFNMLRGVETKVGVLEKDVAAIMRVVKNLSIDQQKQLFYDNRQPEAERLVAGLKYVHQGGNGTVKPEVIVFAAGHRDIYNALIRVKPELGLKHE